MVDAFVYAALRVINLASERKKKKKTKRKKRNVTFYCLPQPLKEFLHKCFAVVAECANGY